jgi:hypothetical protein
MQAMLVCKTWKEVMSDPVFWSVFRVYDSGAIVRNMLKLSKNAPLDVHVVFSEPDTIAAFEPILVHVRRLELLSIYFGSGVNPPMFYLLDPYIPASSLRSLDVRLSKSINSPSARVVVSVLARLTMLEHLSLSFVNVADLQRPLYAVHASNLRTMEITMPGAAFSALYTGLTWPGTCRVDIRVDWSDLTRPSLRTWRTFLTETVPLVTNNATVHPFKRVYLECDEDDIDGTNIHLLLDDWIIAEPQKQSERYQVRPSSTRLSLSIESPTPTSQQFNDAIGALAPLLPSLQTPFFHLVVGSDRVQDSTWDIIMGTLSPLVRVLALQQNGAPGLVTALTRAFASRPLDTLFLHPAVPEMLTRVHGCAKEVKPWSR